MTIDIVNAQRQTPIELGRLRTVARCAAKRLNLRAPGRLSITLLSAQRMRRLNRRYTRHDRPTDVLSFRYEGEPVAGDILIAPALARAYASAHGIPYRQELARYLVHGLLHWRGYEDRTQAQQRKMRQMEDRLLSGCGA